MSCYCSAWISFPGIVVQLLCFVESICSVNDPDVDSLSDIILGVMIISTDFRFSIELKIFMPSGNNA